MAENNVNIPRIIHYCWFGGKPLNRKAQKCIDSWKKFCPDYEMIRWDESNCDISENRYVSEAYQSRKWAFVSDYFRLKAICGLGGVYLDTDVELLKPLDRFLDYKGFAGFEDDAHIATCVMGGVKNLCFFCEALKIYEQRKFLLDAGKFDTTTNVEILTDLLIGNGLKTNGEKQTVMDLEIFPVDFFSPKSLKTGKITLTENTCAVHHFDASWQTGKQKFHTKVAQMIGEDNVKRVKKIIGRR